MFDNLTQRLGRAMKALRGEARLTENNIQDALREVLTANAELLVLWRKQQPPR